MKRVAKQYYRHIKYWYSFRHCSTSFLRFRVPTISLWIFVFISQSSNAQDARAEVLDSFIVKLASRSQFNGNILVAAKGKVIYEKSIGLHSTKPGDSLEINSQFRLASAGKPFTALAIIQLEEAGQIDYDDCIEKYIPEWPYECATIRNLLNHTSGIPSFEETTDQYWKPGLRKDDHSRIITNWEMINLLIENKPMWEFEPGTKFGYSDAGYVLLATIVEVVTGKPYHQYVRENLFIPAGMLDTYAISPVRHDQMKNRVMGMRLKPDGPGYVPSEFRYIDGLGGSSGIYSTVGDLFRLDRALYTSKLVSQSSLKEAYTPAKLKNGQSTRYGFGWFLRDGSVSHDGYATGFGVWIYRELNEENTVIILTTGALYLWSGINQGVMRILHGEEYVIPKKDGMRLVQVSLLNEGEKVARKVYTNLKENHYDDYYFEAGTMNVTGRLMLLDQHAEDALTVFRLNSELYPDVPLVWDGLGDAYLALGDTTNAIQNYQKTLTLDARFRNALKKLQLLTNK